MADLQRVTLAALLDRFGATEPLTRTSPAQQRRNAQLLRTAHALAQELADDLIEFEVAAADGVLSNACLYIQFGVFDGWVRLNVPMEAADLLVRTWSRKVPALGAECSTVEKLAFLVAQRCARHALAARYGVKLLGVGARADTDSIGSTCSLGVTVSVEGGGAEHYVWWIEFDDAAARRCDWYAVRAAAPHVAQRSRRLQQLVGCDDDA